MDNLSSEELCCKINTLSGRRELMQQHNGTWEGINEDGEAFCVTVNEENLTVITNQDNGWRRKDIYDQDGMFCNYTFDGKWNWKENMGW